MRAYVGCLLVFLAPVLVGAALARETHAQGTGDTSAATGISNLLNPAISLNGLLTVTSESAEEESAEPGHEHAHGALSKGFNVQEVEVQLTSTIDPYTQADVVIAMPGLDVIELEEVIIATRHLPGGLGLRAGKLLQNFGRHNRDHTHQFPFIDAPLANESLLGEEGLNEVGAEFSYLTPLPWFSEVLFSAFQGDNERLASEDDEDFGYLLRSRNFWDLSEATTFDLGVSGVAGPRPSGTTYLGGADVRLVWAPAAGGPEAKKLVWQNEWIMVSEIEEEGAARVEPWGAYSLIQAKCTRRFWVQGRYDHLEPAESVDGAPPDDHAIQLANRWSALLGFVPSEFSAIRLQYSALRTGGETDHAVILQFNFTIGSHPAHRY